MVAKSQQLQMRVTPREKAALKRLAAAAGQDVSSYVLSRALPSSQLRFEELIALLGGEADRRYTLAELNELLSSLTPAELVDTVAHADFADLSPFLRNYVAAMVEQASHLKDVPSPAWTARIEPLETPHFATPLRNLRFHLLQTSPVAFKRRNIFVDASVGDRV